MAEPIEIKITGDNDSSKALGAAKQDIVGLGDAAKGAGAQLSKAGADVDGFTAKVHKSSKATDDQATRLDRAGESADNAETRFTGLASGIDGVTTLMDDPSPQEFAQGIADMADGTANSLVPALSKGREMLGGLIDKMGGAKTAALTAAGAAGVGALLIVVKELGEAAHDARIDELTESFLATGDAGDSMRQAVDGAVASQADMADVFSKLLEQNPRLAQQYLDQAEALGLNKDMVESAQEALDRKTAAEETVKAATEEHTTSIQEQADAIRDQSDARLAAVDPIFAFIDAMRSSEESQRAVTDATDAYREAVRKHGEGSTEAADALRDLNDAEFDNVTAAAEAEAAAADLEAQIREHPATLANARLALQRWQVQGNLTAEDARKWAIRFEAAADEAKGFDGTSTRNLNARDNASAKIISVGNRLDELDGRSATVGIFANISGAAAWAAQQVLGNAAGGVVGAASGGVHSGPRIVGENGPEIINLSPGSKVTPASNTAQMLDQWSGGGGATQVVIKVDGSRAGAVLAELLREEVITVHGGNVDAALGYVVR